MEQDTEHMILPLEERSIAHQFWRVRLHQREECVKTFQCIDDAKSSEWNNYIGIIKKFVADSNAPVQEKGLEVTLAFVKNDAIAGKIVNEVMNGIVSKCIAAPEAKTKELAVQITLMYIEIGNHEAVQQALLKGTEAKDPKIVSACIATLTLALKEFGPEVINLNPLIKKMASFLEDRDETVREKGKTMVVEMYRWMGDRLQQQLNTLKLVHIMELEKKFSNLADEKVAPTRYLRWQKLKNMVNNGNSEFLVVDPYDLLSPVDILSKLPKDFYEKVEATKWQERKEALEALETLVKNPKLENGDYSDVVMALKKIISKDINVQVVTLAGKCLAYLAAGLKKRFQPYATTCLPTILEKFREKKQSVVQALREAADAIYQSISIDLILEDTLAALENKNPAVKAETAAYLARCFAHTSPANVNKKLLKPYIDVLLKTLNEPHTTVRNNSAEALSMAMKLIGEKNIDNLKMTKIKEQPNTAPVKVESQRANKAEQGELEVWQVEFKEWQAKFLETFRRVPNEPDPTVRDNSAEAPGTAMKLIGEKAMMPFLTDIDNLKMTKIKEQPNTAPVKVKSQRANKAEQEELEEWQVEFKEWQAKFLETFRRVNEPDPTASAKVESQRANRAEQVEFKEWQVKFLEAFIEE